MKKVSWTVPEIEQLTQLTEHSRKFDKKIDWNVVAAQIPSRTASQCKSYYANVLKKTLDVPIRQNHKWNRGEIIALWALCVNFDKDYAFIQKNYIPNLSVKQISSQFSQIQQKQQIIYCTFKKVLRKPDYIQHLSEQDFCKQWQILLAAVRHSIVRTVNQISQQQIADSQLFNNDFELKSMNTFFLDVDPHALIDIYSQEAMRRNISSESLVQYYSM
ncbi:Myb-like_DNA-binding domain-containing protein [Hexamita inflata]|uniref:Myb-like DNA-binding domain-containing protein n=1 Tax=Hexamita inflata TaxID=28002 RepID=A0AA86PK38_9EUKA|nr:Myb-like DNA-binding domain-containing protein [Hexamita inflata]CAI9952490.1 Myb-like DNA-binding domain-containing protein [Hexamita inflata]